MKNVTHTIIYLLHQQLLLLWPPIMQDHTHCYDINTREAVCEEIDVVHLQCRHNAADMRAYVNAHTDRLCC